eukprot:5929367-Alexandrium_andersonii.AAC.1
MLHTVFLGIGKDIVANVLAELIVHSDKSAAKVLTAYQRDLRTFCRRSKLPRPRRPLSLNLIGWTKKSYAGFPFLYAAVKAADCKTMLYWIADV